MRFDSFFHMLTHYAETAPDSPALVYGQKAEKALTFRDLRSAVEERSAVLSDSGKTSLGILSDGTADCVIEIFAAAKAGMQIVMLDESLPDEVLGGLIRYTDVDCLWGDPDLTEDLAPFLTEGTESGSRRILFFTSGTTARSKAVVLTEESLMASAWNGSSVLPLSPSDRLLCMLPLGHVFGFVCGLLWGLSCGASVALGRGARHYADDCSLYRPTALSAVPMLWGFLVKQRAVNPELKLVLIGAGGCPLPLLAAGTAMGIRMCFGYGLTETSSGIALSTEGDPYAMQICPDDEVTIAPDGEILVRTPHCIMQGYYKKPDDTAAVLRDGVLSTGDLGRIGEDGKLRITGRKKEMLVLSDGTKVFLPEYEAECAEALGIAELCVVLRDGALTLVIGGGTDPGTVLLRGEKDAAAAVLRKLQGVMEKRPRGQQLRGVEFLDAPLPRTAAGKIRRWEV